MRQNNINKRVRCALWIVETRVWTLDTKREPKINENEEANLSDEELGDPFRQPSLLAGQYHLEHVTLELLHDNKDALRRFKHALQVDNARMRQILQNGNFVLQLIGLLSWETHLVNHFDGNWSIGLSMGS